ncbi:glycosyltransferase family 39 protein [Leptospira kanakyensis]|uniref:glycosyltransferase family 39 protein n=1 Tax=Leptospira kanakyensis TaxID=2484968 RepID=UPI00223E8579|nr:glycosyltransferase family 39 protein [Leptospira kanakyensis]MCW7469823.1 glycosyltransferase family 39 protein [Leptospira kanakyensis]
MISFIIFQVIDSRFTLDKVSYGSNSNFNSFAVLYLIISVVLSFFLPRDKFIFLGLQVVFLPIYFSIHSLIFGLGLGALILGFLIVFVSAIHFFGCNDFEFKFERDQSLYFVTYLIFCLTVVMLGILNLSKLYWMDEYCVGASLVDGMMFMGYDKYAGLQSASGIITVTKTFSDVLANVMVYDSHPPFSEAIFYFVSKAFGLHLGILRLVSMILGATIVSFFFFILVRYAGYIAGIISSFLLLLSPDLIQYFGVEVRAYIFSMLFSLLIIHYFFKSINSGSGNDFFLWIVFSVFHIYNHHFGIFLVLTIFGFSIVLPERKRFLNGFYLIGLFSFPLLQVIIFQKYAKKEWLSLSNLHMSKIGLKEILDFFNQFSGINSNVVSVVILFSLIALSIYGLSKLKIESIENLSKGEIRLIDSNSGNEKMKGIIWLMIVFFVPIFLFREFNGYLKPFYKQIAVNDKYSFRDLLDYILIFQYFAYFLLYGLYFFNLKFIGVEKPNRFRLPLVTLNSFIFVIAAFLVIVVVNSTAKIYTFRNVIFLVIPIIYVLALSIDSISRKIITHFLTAEK